jgi:hypothetical protein
MEKFLAQYSKIIEDILKTYGKDMLAAKPLDADKFSKSYAKDPLKFYIKLIAAMAKFESGFKPECTYTESFEDVKGKKVISRGLLQLSIESCNSYGAKLKDAKELHDPITNLKCGVLILNKWIKKDNYIGSAKLGGARYWSCLRDTSKSQAKIRALTNTL